MTLTPKPSGDFDLWQHAVQCTGYMDTQSTTHQAEHVRGREVNDGSSHKSESEDNYDNEDGNLANLKDDSEDQEGSSDVEDVLNDISHTEDTILKQAFALFRQGRHTPASNTSLPEYLTENPQVVGTTTQWIRRRHYPAAYGYPVPQQLQNLQLRGMTHQR